MPARTAVAPLALGGLLAGVAACGGSGGGPTGPAVPAAAATGTLAVQPTAGPIGTTFALLAAGQRPGGLVSFEITFPGEGKAFPGSALTVAQDGTVTASYRATGTNKPGEYLVRLTGTSGTLAEARFSVTDGAPVTTAAPKPATGASSSSSATSGGSRSSTTRARTSTTRKAATGATSTTRAPSSSSTTAGPSPSTTARSTTTAPPTTKKPTTSTTS